MKLKKEESTNYTNRYEIQKKKESTNYTNKYEIRKKKVFIRCNLCSFVD